MNIDLPTEQRAFIDGLVASGRFPTFGAAISEAIHLLISQERLQQEVELGIRQADRGEVRDHHTVFAQLRAMAVAQNGDRGR